MKSLSHEVYRGILDEGGEQSVEYHRLASQNHVVELRQQSKRGLSGYNDKVYQLDVHRSRPHGPFKNNEAWAAMKDRLPASLQKIVLGFVQGTGVCLTRQMRCDGRICGRFEFL